MRPSVPRTRTCVMPLRPLNATPPLPPLASHTHALQILDAITQFPHRAPSRHSQLSRELPRGPARECVRVVHFAAAVQGLHPSAAELRHVSCVRLEKTPREHDEEALATLAGFGRTGVMIESRPAHTHTRGSARRPAEPCHGPRAPKIARNVLSVLSDANAYSSCTCGARQA